MQLHDSDPSDSLEGTKTELVSWTLTDSRTPSVLFALFCACFGFSFVEAVSRAWCWCLQGGETLSVRRQQLEELYSAHSGSLSILMEAGDANGHHQDFPEGPANFTLLWY